MLTVTQLQAILLSDALLIRKQNPQGSETDAA
jgi:hypothetical protein